jgi:hypothetical protein
MNCHYHVRERLVVTGADVKSPEFDKFLAMRRTSKYSEGQSMRKILRCPVPRCPCVAFIELPVMSESTRLSSGLSGHYDDGEEV